MSIEVSRRLRELEEANKPCALATVVAVDRPVSARAGDSAVILASGRLDGWVGGSCSEPIVIREALAALADGESRLVRIRPPGAARELARPGVVTEVTACASEGGLDVFIEPRMPRPHLVIAGSSPAARMLVKLAKQLAYRTTATLDGPNEQVPGVEGTLGVAELARLELGHEDAVVVATMNRYDEVALEAALATGAGYVGLVASRARGQVALAALRARGASQEQLARVHSPAGFDLGPSSQEEIALAIMAEVVAERHRSLAEDEPSPMCAPEEMVREAVDPVCGMKVAVVEGAITAELDGTTFYFCAPGCRDRWLEEHERRGASGKG